MINGEDFHFLAKLLRAAIPESKTGIPDEKEEFFDTYAKWALEREVKNIARAICRKYQLHKTTPEMKEHNWPGYEVFLRACGVGTYSFDLLNPSDLKQLFEDMDFRAGPCLDSNL